MVFHYMGKYNMNPDELPYIEHEPNAVPFMKPRDSKTLGLIANGISIGILAVTISLFFLRAGITSWSLWGSILAFAAIIPHECLHALCFKNNVYMYTDLRHGMLFVVGPERMSKGRFVLMAMLPNIVLGIIPFVIFLIKPELTILGVLGAISIPMGAGDYLNVFNALTQMPKGARTYLYKFNSFWYMPSK